MSCLDLHYAFVSINCRKATSFSHWRCWKRMGWLLFLLKVLDFRQWSIFPANEVILTKPAFPRGGEETWGKCRRKEKLLLPLLGFMGEDSPLPTPALVATRREVMGTHSSRQTSAPISVSPRALQWLSILNTLPRLSHLGKTVGGEAKTTFIMFKFCNKPFRVLLLASPCPALLFKIAFVSQTLFFLISKLSPPWPGYLGTPDTISCQGN